MLWEQERPLVRIQSSRPTHAFVRWLARFLGMEVASVRFRARAPMALSLSGRGPPFYMRLQQSSILWGATTHGSAQGGTSPSYRDRLSSTLRGASKSWGRAACRRRITLDPTALPGWQVMPLLRSLGRERFHHSTGATHSYPRKELHTRHVCFGFGQGAMPRFSVVGRITIEPLHHSR